VVLPVGARIGFRHLGVLGWGLGCVLVLGDLPYCCGFDAREGGRVVPEEIVGGGFR
jgi:hypothetical protein